jgi:hypothetical protein
MPPTAATVTLSARFQQSHHHSHCNTFLFAIRRSGPHTCMHTHIYMLWKWWQKLKSTESKFWLLNRRIRPLSLVACKICWKPIMDLVRYSRQTMGTKTGHVMPVRQGMQCLSIDASQMRNNYFHIFLWKTKKSPAQKPIHRVPKHTDDHHHSTQLSQKTSSSKSTAKHPNL